MRGFLESCACVANCGMIGRDAVINTRDVKLILLSRVRRVNPIRLVEPLQTLPTQRANANKGGNMNGLLVVKG